MNQKTLFEVLDKLSNARDEIQFKQMLSGYFMSHRQDPFYLRELQNIENIWRIGKRRR